MTFIITLLSKGVRETLRCNHARAPILAVSDPSIFNTCQQIAYECESYDKFSEGKCADCGSDGNKCKPLGLWLDFWDNPNNNLLEESQTQKKFFIKTSEMLPFCLFHYQIVVNFIFN